MPFQPSLMKHTHIKGTLICKSGLRIGGSKEDLEIGGIDNPILRDPVTKFPYIPGSSLKGKLRSILEYKYNRVGWHVDRGNLVQSGGEPCGCGQEIDKCPVCTIFGPHRNMRHNLGPSRIIIRDALLSSESQKDLEKLIKDGLLYSEIKTENIIDRRKNVAVDPRQMERIPAGTKFNLEISIRIFQGDDEKKMVGYVREGLNLIEEDYLGGSGTRGYGWVKIENLTETEK